jgi:hypothetical protein
MVWRSTVDRVDSTRGVMFGIENIKYVPVSESAVCTLVKSEKLSAAVEAKCQAIGESR